jgi:hypothetical protein
LALTVLGLGWKFLDVGGRLDLLSRIVEGMGGSPAMVASTVSSIWFSIALVICGVAYIVFVGEPEKGVQRQAFWPYLGWIVFGLCFTAMVATVSYGAIELHIRREIAKGIAGVPRNTPDANAPDRPQRPLYSGPRNITPDQIRILAIEADKIKSIVPTFMITAPPRDNEAWQYREQFHTIFTRAGIVINYGEQFPRGLDEVGIMLGVKDIKNIPFQAQKVREMLEVANIHVNLISPVVYPQMDFVLFIGPQPML